MAMVPKQHERRYEQVLFDRLQVGELAVGMIAGDEHGAHCVSRRHGRQPTTE
jgi:hypothetical protein